MTDTKISIAFTHEELVETVDALRLFVQHAKTSDCAVDALRKVTGQLAEAGRASLAAAQDRAYQGLDPKFNAALAKSVP